MIPPTMRVLPDVEWCAVHHGIYRHDIDGDNECTGWSGDILHESCRFMPVFVRGDE